MLEWCNMINMIVIDSWDAVYDTFWRELGCCWYNDSQDAVIRNEKSEMRLD